MDLGLDKEKQQELGEEQGREIQKVGKSALNGVCVAGNQFSEDAKDGMDWIGQKLGIDYNKPLGNGKTYGEIREEEKQELDKEQKRLEEEAPYKEIFNEVKNDLYKGLNIASLVMAIHSLPTLAKAGFGAVKDLNIALKSLGMDIKLIDEGIYSIENNSKKVVGKLSKKAEELRAELKKLLGTGAEEFTPLEKLKLLTERNPKIKSNLLNDVSDRSAIIDRVKEIRNELPSKYKKSGNLAVADVDINGLDKKEFFSHNGVDKLNDTLKERLPDISLKPEEDVFKYTTEITNDGRSVARNIDSEYKILTDIHNNMIDSNASGSIRLFTEKEPCSSCLGVIEQFTGEHPNVSIEVIHNSGDRLIK